MKLPQHPRVTEPTLRLLAAKTRSTLLTVAPGATGDDALALMADSGQDAVAVTEGDRTLGVFSLQDYARMARGGGGAVKDGMTALEPLDPALTLRACLGMMAEKGLRHVPVIEKGRLVALCSGEEIRDEILRFDERVFYEMGIDWQMLFWRGVYSC